MQGWIRYLQLKAQSKTGFSGGLLTWAAIAVLCAVGTVFFAIVAAFVWLAERYGSLNAALALGAFFLLITIIAIVSCVVSHRRTVERAKLELAARRHTAWLDPGLLGLGLQMSRAIKWRKVAPLVVVGVLAAGLGMQWFGRDKASVDGSDVRRLTVPAA